jgi:enoyl-CoA hydratase/carnithine racemase
MLSEFAEGRLIARVEGPVGWLVFNQPERLNAVRYDMWASLPSAISELTADPGVRCIIARGAGDKAFVSGADIAEFETERRDAETNRVFTKAVTAATVSLMEAPLPVIAMINGFCIGGGMVISSACDFRLCSDVSRFGVPAGRLGLGYELDNLKRLVSIMGPGFAMEMLATARHFSAEEARLAGFVNRVVPADQLEALTLAYAGMVADLAPLTLKAAKLAKRAALDPKLDATAQAAIDVCFDSHDYAEGRAAFAAKRKPVFKGR